MVDSPLINDSFSVDKHQLDALEASVLAARESLRQIGPVVRVVRTRLRWSQSKLAEYFAMPVGRLGAVEQARLVPSVDDAVLMLRWIRAFAPVQDSLAFGVANEIAPLPEHP